jgi:hypothetical protein
MNPNDTAALPFFLQYLESQTETDTLSTTNAAPWCSGPYETRSGGYCFIDTKKYPSDGDDTYGPR